MPKAVLSGTAMAAISIVSQKAWIAAGVVTESYDRAQARLERPVEDEADRHEQQHGQVGQRDRPQEIRLPTHRGPRSRASAASTSDETSSRTTEAAAALVVASLSTWL